MARTVETPQVALHRLLDRCILAAMYHDETLSFSAAKLEVERFIKAEMAIKFSSTNNPTKKGK